MMTAFSFAPLFILHAAINLKVFDHLAIGDKTAEALTQACDASPRGMTALLDALVGLGWLEKSGRLYRLNPDSEKLLVSSKPSFAGEIFQHFVSDILPAFQQLEDIIRSGKPARAVNQQQVGSAFFQGFVASLFPMFYAPAQKLASSLSLHSGGKHVKVLDLAAGSGVWSIAVAQAFPNVSVTAIDWPDVLSVTRKMAERFGVGDRYRYVGGDLAEADFGQGYTVALLGNILHSEGDKRSEQLLRKTYESLAPNGTIAIADFILEPDRVSPVPAVIFNINMLVNTDEGRVYSFDEIATWLRNCGFRNIRTLEAPCSSPLILADK
jgi:SAM-dependent methyltransferase